MAQPDGESRPQFSRPGTQVLLMVVSLVLAGLGILVALPQVGPVITANPYLNYFILFVFVVGVGTCFLQLYQLFRSVRWIETFAAGITSDDGNTPELLVPLANLLRSRGARMHLSSSSAQSILDTVSNRIEEQRELTRYIVNLLIFLGLLGTFYGLATTIPALLETIKNMAPKDGESSVEVFKRLITGLNSQLSGMGVAFASSLLGLAGSLIVGLLELFASHGQNRFFGELEVWLSGITRVGFASGDEAATGFGPDAGVMNDVLDHMAEQMESLQEMYLHSDQSRAQVDQKLNALIDVISEMNDRMDRSDSTSAALEQVAAGQEAVVEALRAQGTGEGMDAESRMRLRSIDVQMLRILEEISAGRQESLAELRKDIDMLVKALARPRAAARRPARDIFPGERPRPDGEE